MQGNGQQGGILGGKEDVRGNDIEELEYCEECGSCTLGRVKVLGNEYTMRFQCSCEEMKEEVDHLASDDGRCKMASEVVRRYLKAFPIDKEVNGIVFYGTPRQGKTFYAEMIREAIKGCFMDTVASIIQQAQLGSKVQAKENIDRAKGARLTILDDLGAQRNTEFANEVLFEIVDYRYKNHLPLIVTTNLTVEELGNPETVEGQRLCGRILERCFPVEVEAGRDSMNIRGYEEFLR